MPLGSPQRDTTAIFFHTQKSPGRVSGAFGPPRLMTALGDVQHQSKATATLRSHVGGKPCHWVPTHLEGVEEVPEGPSIYHIVVHGEEEGDDDAGNSCGHRGRRSVSGETLKCPGPHNTWGSTAASTGQGVSCTGFYTLAPEGVNIQYIIKNKMCM